MKTHTHLPLNNVTRNRASKPPVAVKRKIATEVAKVGGVVRACFFNLMKIQNRRPMPLQGNRAGFAGTVNRTVFASLFMALLLQTVSGQILYLDAPVVDRYGAYWGFSGTTHARNLNQGENTPFHGAQAIIMQANITETVSIKDMPIGAMPIDSSNPFTLNSLNFNSYSSLGFKSFPCVYGQNGLLLQVVDQNGVGVPNAIVSNEYLGNGAYSVTTHQTDQTGFLPLTIRYFHDKIYKMTITAWNYEGLAFQYRHPLGGYSEQVELPSYPQGGFGPITTLPGVFGPASSKSISEDGFGLRTGEPAIPPELHPNLVPLDPPRL